MSTTTDMLPIIGRLTLDLDGERLVVAPITKADMEAIQATDDAFAILEIFARLVEEPADAAERGVLWVGRAALAWRDEVDALVQRMRLPNRAARRAMH